MVWSPVAFILLTLLVLGAIVAFGILVLNRTSLRVDMTPRCGACGYNLTGAPGNRCSECGKLFIEAGIIRAGATPDEGSRRKAILLSLLVVVVLFGCLSSGLFVSTIRRAPAAKSAPLPPGKPGATMTVTNGGPPQIMTSQPAGE